MKLADYFQQPIEAFLQETPSTGVQTEWLDFHDFDLKGTSILIVDAQFVPSKEDGLLVSLDSGKYLIQAKANSYGGDRRISRLRIFRKNTIPQLCSEIGKTWTDTANTGICDFEIFSKAWGNDDDASYEIIQEDLETDNSFGTATLDAARGAVMPFVHSGFGDGSFSVFELVENGVRVGFEIEFIAAGEKYPFGETPFERESRIQKKIRERAGDNNAEGQWELGTMYQTGKEVEKNAAEAAKWFAKASQNGHAEAATALGTLYHTGNGVTKDYVRAREHYELAAARGYALALNQLGILYRYGYGVPLDPIKAVEYYLASAKKGLAAAQFNLGVNYARGLGVEKNFEEAVKWYRLAVSQGHLGAICNLGICYKNGTGVFRDKKEAVRLFQKGADKGHALCANNLGDCYETGCGIEMDLKKAFAWYSVAAIGDVAIAQKSVGTLAKNGLGGVKKDLGFALRCFKKAAKNGNAEALYELGLLHEHGEGLTQDKVQACKYYRQAVEKNFLKAAERLGKLLSELTVAEQRTLENLER
ncbi:MAG: SEL1-like repeat protein [Verrucomicrobiota bacterium]|nr:SEL1-like repeat protein [Verrucomicrobiota bacterium]